MRRVAILSALFWVAASLQLVYGHHVKMSGSAASRLDHYNRSGDWRSCVSLDSRYVRKNVLFDNHHVMIYLSDDEIFLGEAAHSGRCVGLSNGVGLHLAAKQQDRLCKGDEIISYRNGLPRKCVLERFQELIIPE